jgi:hypothetical protein
MLAPRFCPWFRLRVLPIVALPITQCLAGCGSRTGLLVDEDYGVVECKEGTVVLSPAYPSVMFVLDRSTSMSTAITTNQGSSTRWEAMRTALSTTLPAIDTTVKVGALFFPSDSARESCSVASSADLTPATGNVTPLVELMNETSPGGATPTADALDSAAQVLLAQRAARSARALVLATDGAPDCNGELDPSSCRCVPDDTSECRSSTRCLDDARTTATIAAQYQAHGIPTYVIGIQDVGASTYGDVLDAMAVAGGRAQTGTSQSYYAASSGAELEAALVTIRNQVRTCVYLTESVPDVGGFIQLSVDGTPLLPDTWYWGSRANGEIVLGPDLCQKLAEIPQQTLSATVSCASD